MINLLPPGDLCISWKRETRSSEASPAGEIFGALPPEACEVDGFETIETMPVITGAYSRCEESGNERNIRS
jgi:hypothetical protein